MIDALATSVGDTQTAKLARDIRAEEERMAKFIGELLPQLATDVAHDEIPVSEIEGPAKRRKSRRPVGLAGRRPPVRDRLSRAHPRRVARSASGRRTFAAQQPS